MSTTFAGHLLDGTHAARPAATAVPDGTLYACTDHTLIYQSDGATWSTWADVGGTGSVATDPIYDAKGDLPIGTGADTAVKLTVGANGLALIAASGETTGQKWGTPDFIGAKVYNSAAQTISHNVTTAVTFDTEDIDTDAFHSTSVNTERFTVPSGKDGKYLCVGFSRLASNTTGYRAGEWSKNGSSVFGWAAMAPSIGGGPTGVLAVTVMDLVATDYMFFEVYQSSGGNLDAGHASARAHQSEASFVFLGP